MSARAVATAALAADADRGIRVGDTADLRLNLLNRRTGADQFTLDPQLGP